VAMRVVANMCPCAVHAVMAGVVDTQATGPAQYVAFCPAALTMEGAVNP